MILGFINTILRDIGIDFTRYGYYGNILQTLLVDLIGGLIVFIAAALVIVVIIYIFRKYMADLQQRIGPNRVGPYGSLQLIADALKMFGKEDIIPDRADKLLFRIAPYLSFTPLILSYLLIPYGGWATFVNLPVTLLLIIGFSALAPISEVIAGFASGNKFSLLGGLRAAAQDLSYEIPMVLSAVAVVIVTGSLNLLEISKSPIPLAIIEPIGFFIFFLAMIAKIGVVPFDLPESESELVSGFNVEYSGLRFGIFYLGVFGNIFFTSLLISTIYLGGGSSFIIPGEIWILVKAFIFTFIFMTIWVTLPRIRVDKFMKMGWKILFPLAILNLVWSIFIAIYLPGVT